MRNWYMYMHALDGMEELYMRNDFEFFKTFFCQHPETEKVIEAIKETGRIEWLNYDRANHVTQDYLAYAKDPEGFGPRCKVPVMVMFPEDDMFLWKTQAIDTPSLYGRRVPHRDHPGRPLVDAGSPGRRQQADAGVVRL